eukprot:3911446-Rhodomonas_salina.3
MRELSMSKSGNAETKLAPSSGTSFAMSTVGLLAALVCNLLVFFLLLSTSDQANYKLKQQGDQSSFGLLLFSSEATGCCPETSYAIGVDASGEFKGEFDYQLERINVY